MNKPTDKDFTRKLGPATPMDTGISIFDQNYFSFNDQNPLFAQTLDWQLGRLDKLPSSLLRVEKLEIPVLTTGEIPSSIVVSSSYPSKLDPFFGASLVVNAEAVNISLLEVKDSLKNLLQQPNYHDRLQLAFGTGWQEETASVLINNIAQGKNSPEIKIVKVEALQARGAFSQQTNTIYLAQEFVEQNSTDAIAKVLIEELGHYIDSKLNPVDSPGDEGEVFAALVDGTQLTPAQIQALKAEDDYAIRLLDGQLISIEQASLDKNSAITRLDNLGEVLRVPGNNNEGTTLLFQWTTREAAYNNEIGVFVVDEQGRVNGIKPTEAGYAQAALTSASRQVLFSSGQRAGDWRQLTFQEGQYLAFYLIQNNTAEDWLATNPQNQLDKKTLAFFSIKSANPDNFNHVKSQDMGESIWQLRWEDLVNGGDQDFNDVVFNVSLLGLKTPGDLGQIVTAQISLIGKEAKFKHEMGLFLVDDAYGRIGNLTPDNPNYINAALSADRRQVIFDFAQPELTTVNLNLPAGQYIGWYLISNGTTEQFLSSNPTNLPGKSINAFFSYSAANPDGLNHVHHQGQNELVWEDLFGGRDRDYNDLIFRFNFATPNVVNDSPTGINLNLTNNRENIAPDSVIGEFTTIDPNPQNTHVYTLVNGEGAEDNVRFKIIGNKLIITQYTDFETKPTYKIRIRTTDQSGLNFEQSLVVNITDFNEAPSDILLDGSSVEENVAGAVIGTISVTDTDTSPAFINNTVSVNDDRFEVIYNNGTLQLKLKDGRSLDYEVETTIPLILTATDANDSSLTYSKNFTISVTDINENVQLPTLSASVANDTGINNSDRLTQDPTVSGQTTNAITLQGNLNGNSFVDISDALNEDGSFTISLEQYDVLSNGVLPDGDYTLELKAKNSTGQASEIVTVSFTLDLTPPLVSFELASESDTGMLRYGITSDRFITLVGQTEPGLTVALLETQQMLTADSQGNFNFTDVAMPVAGKAPFTIVAVDAAGNQGRSQQFLTREGINGTPEITSTPENIFDTETQSTYTYQIAAIDPDGDELTYTLLNTLQGAEIDKNGLLSFTPSGTLRSSYNFSVEVSDGRGGTDSQTITVEVPILANLGTIKGIKWNDINRNGVRDNELVQGANPDVVYVLDVSGSVDFEFVGSPIGDFNGDGLENTRLDAEIAAFIALNQQLNNQGLGDRAQVAIVVYSGFTANADMDLDANGLQLTTRLGTDSDGDGKTDVEKILRSIRSGAFGVGNFTGTNPEAALQKVEETFASIGTQTGNGNVIFLTNGEQNRGGSIVDEVERLKVQGFNLSAFGVGNDASLSVIQMIDSEGIKFTSIDEILDAFGGLGQGSISTLESGLAGVSVYLDINNNQQLDPGEPSQVTAEDDPSTPDIDETGQYEFNNLAPGTYIVREIIPDGFEQTFPLRNIASSDFHIVELEAREIAEKIDFGNVQIVINQDPIITSTPIIEALVGQPYEYLVRANDPDGDPLNFSLNQAPEGMVIDPQTGRIFYAPTITTITSNFDTSDSQIRPGIDNQASFTDDNQGLNFGSSIGDHAIGEGFRISSNLPVGPLFRSAVSFDLSSLSSQVTFAKLQLQKNHTSGEPIETLGLFEVTTDANTLYTSSYVSPAIYEDLGTGRSYGTFDVSTGGNTNEILEFELNEAAIAAINSARGDFFSIGLALLSANPNNTTQAAEYLFAFSSNAGIQRLVLETENEKTVEIFVSDGKGGEAIQNYTLSIAKSSNNQPPVITSNPEISIALGETYEYQIQATDPDADFLTYSLINFPDELEIDEFGKITWTPTQIGEFALEIEVSDGRGGYDTQVYSIEVVNNSLNDTVAPQVNLGFNSTVYELGETLNLQIQGFDNVGLADLDLSFNGDSLILTPNTVANGLINNASVTLNTTGVFEVLAKATDFAGNTSTKTLSVRVINPNDKEAPITELDLSGFDTLNPVISELTDIVGTINDPDLEFYRVELAPVSLIDLSNPAANDPDYITIAEGRANVDNGVLAQIDPHLYRNDSYYIRVYTQDYSGNINVQGVVLSINSQNKPGRFALEFTDLSIPLTGIPIEIQRRYDSLDAQFSGDFGYGWSLGLQDAQIQEAAPTGVDLSRDNFFFGGNSFTVGTRVTLTTPDGRRVGFTFNPVPDLAGLLGVLYKPTFTPDAGVYDRLEVDYTPLSVRSDGSVGLYLFGFTYNPSQYRLITKDGTTYRYDQYKGLLDVTDRNGNKLTYTDAGIFSSTGQSITFKRDAQGRIAEIIDPAGKGIIYNYDAQGNLVGITDQEGLTSTNTYLSSLPHYLEKIIDSRGNAVIKTEYNAQGRVIGTTDALGNVISNSYDVNTTGSTTTQVDPLGNSTTITRDDRGNIISVRDEVGAITKFTYDANNNPLTVTDPRGFTTTRTFDARGNLTSITDALGNIRILTYDEFNNVKSETNSLGHTTQFVYDVKGNLIELIDATGQKDRFYYDNTGRVSSFTDANGNTITFAYEGTTLNKPTQVTFSDGSTQKIEYNQFGQITRLTDENGNATSYVTDFVGRLIAQVDPLGNQTTYTYDAQLITSITDPLGNKVNYEYDDAGRLIRQIDSLNGVIQFSYDALGRRISETDPLGNQTTTTYRGDGLITAVTDANGYTTTFEYDLAGNQTAVIDPLGNRTVFGYDALGRQVNKTDPLGNVTTYNYDALNNLIGIIDRNNRQRTFTYDAVNRLVQENWLNDGSLIQATNFTYDAVGNLLSVTNPDSTNTFSYDSRDRVTQASINILGLSPIVFNYGYDRTSKRTFVSDNLGVSVNSTYDSRNLLISQTWQGTGIDPARVDYSYNSKGDRTQIQRFSDLAGTQLAGSSSLNYDALQRLTGITHSNSAGSNLANYSYSYNLASFLNSETYKGQTINYTYDLTNQLTNADRSLLPDENYTYDANGNSMGSSFIVGVNNQILSDGQFNYTYDKEGNLATKSNIATGVMTTYNYDFRNRLVGVVDRNLSGNTTQSVEFKYDAFDRRISKTVNGQTTYFVNDGDKLWAELNPAGEIISRYLQGADVDELIARYRPSEGTSWYLTDRLGTIRDMANAVGNLVNSIDYDSFGEILGQTNPNVGDRFTFAGRELDSETGLYYNRARYYDANLGRFISQDPIGFAGEDANLYRYVGNNPVNATDPSGLIAAIEYGSLIKTQVLGVNGTVPGAIIGGLQGFGFTSLIFIGNILEISSRGGDIIAEWGSAIAKTKKVLEDIEKLLKRFESVDTEEGLVKGFVSGAGVDIFNIELGGIPGKIAKASGVPSSLEDIAPDPIRKLISLRQGGFEEGYTEGLDYLKALAPK